MGREARANAHLTPEQRQARNLRRIARSVRNEAHLERMVAHLDEPSAAIVRKVMEPALPFTLTPATPAGSGGGLTQLLDAEKGGDHDGSEERRQKEVLMEAQHEADSTTGTA